MPSSGETWRNEPGCQLSDICSDGFRGFRFARIRVVRGAAAIAAVGVDLPAAVRTEAEGWFLSSNEELNRIWYGSAYTVQLSTGPFAAAAADPRGCPVPEGLVVVTDGAKRDRCPWLGDQAVIAATMLTYSKDVSPVENTLALFASRQHRDGYIPSSPTNNWAVELFDYPFYWVLALHDLYLHRANRAYLVRWWPTLERVLDRFLPSRLNADGLLVTRPGGDYGFLHRQGNVVAYYNAIALNALRAGAELARLRRLGAVERRWIDRADRLAGSFTRVFWDAGAGAFLDTPTGPPIHPRTETPSQRLRASRVDARAPAPGAAQRQAVGELDRRQRRLRLPVVGHGVQRARVPVHELLRESRALRVRARRDGARATAAHMGIHGRPAEGRPGDDVGGDRPVRLHRRLPGRVRKHGFGVVLRRRAAPDALHARRPADEPRLCVIHDRASPCRPRLGAGRRPDPTWARHGRRAASGRQAESLRALSARPEGRLRASRTRGEAAQERRRDHALAGSIAGDEELPVAVSGDGGAIAEIAAVLLCIESTCSGE